MSDPIFDSRSLRHDLPYLFAGQAQKEGYVNEAFARIDTLLHMAVEGTANSPPAVPVEGECWLVGSAPSGDWIGHSGLIAALNSGNWLFFSPRDGMRVLNRATGQEMRFVGGWQVPARPDLPTGGQTVDAQARSAIAAIVDCLTGAGLLAAG